MNSKVIAAKNNMLVRLSQKFSGLFTPNISKKDLFTVFQKMFLQILEEYPFTSAYDREYILKHMNVDIKEISSFGIYKTTTIVVIRQELAMAVARGEWNYGGDPYIITKVMISDGEADIFRQHKEVIPKPFDHDHSIPPDERSLLDRYTSTAFDLSREHTVHMLKRIIQPIIFENIMVILMNLKINNNDAEMD